MLCGNNGLENLGNTCYMNSIIQCLSHLLIFHPKNKKLINYINNKDTKLFDQWLDLNDKIWKNTSSVISPRNFIIEYINQLKIHKIDFVSFAQNDCEEFLHTLFDLLHISIKKNCSVQLKDNITDDLIIDCSKKWNKSYEKDYSYIIDRFYSQMITSTKCNECDHISNTIDPFLLLQLVINNSTNTIYDALNLYTNDSLDDNNKWNCDKCKHKVNANINIQLSKTSDVLIIQLKKYNNLNQFIKYPDKLDMSNYSLNYNNKGTTYELISMSIHSGGLNGGHYYAVCKNILDKQWRIYNDSNVSLISNHLDYKPYCLFYKRII